MICLEAWEMTKPKYNEICGGKTFCGSEKVWKYWDYYCLFLSSIHLFIVDSLSIQFQGKEME